MKEAIDGLRVALIALPRPVKALIAFVVDVFGLTLSGIVAIWMLSASMMLTAADVGVVAVTIASAVILVWHQGLYRSVLRYVGSDVLFTSNKVALGTGIAGFLIALVYAEGLPAARWGIASYAFALIYVGASRYLACLFLLNRKASRQREKVIIYGAGSAGAQLALNLMSSDRFTPVAMIDDAPDLHGKRVKGLEIYAASEIDNLIRRYDASRVLLAMPSASRYRRREVLKLLSEHPVHVQTIPEISDIVSGRARVDDITDVDVKDLLGRDPVPPNESLLRASVTNKSVMVTGAGGSIGSELCRQILRLGPRRLVLVENCEPSLYRIDKELVELAQELGGDCEVVPLLGSVLHQHRLCEAMQTFEVATIYHAAAYKHVPIVEHNIFEGIHNNVFGTFRAASAAIDAGVKSFVLISTDKAVNPTNVMGATKRFAELILQALNARNPATCFSMVRFGNVLESSGSVVPLFKEQIRSGGPVTVTHRDIIRYFMTIPEAAQLVIQAGAMAKGGDVFVLDMGKPVKILDLAKRMINLMGMTVKDSDHPNGDVEIEFIGLRPAEKLYEELLIGHRVSGTRHRQIMRADEESLSMEAITDYLQQLEEAATRLDYDRARNVLLDAVKEYNPSNTIDDLVWVRKAAGGTDTREDTVINFPGRPTNPQ